MYSCGQGIRDPKWKKLKGPNIYVGSEVLGNLGGETRIIPPVNQGKYYDIMEAEYGFGSLEAG